MSTTNENTLWEEKNSIEPKKNCLNNNATELNDIINDTSNVSTKNPCNDTGKISGIYKIVNKVNGKYYVGSSNDMCSKFGRWYQHKKRLIKNTHINEHLQNAWNKYGESNFEFSIVEQCDIDQLLMIEQKYLDVVKTNRRAVYNIQFISSGGKIYDIHPMLGKKHTPESNSKNSLSNKIAQSGEKNARYNHAIYTFYNQFTNSKYEGTMYNFYKKYNIEKGRVYSLIKNKKGNRSVKGWTIDINQKIGNLRGNQHPLSDKKIYVFFNQKTNEIYDGTRCDFSLKYGFPLHRKMFSKSKPNQYSHKGWIIRSHEL